MDEFLVNHRALFSSSYALTRVFESVYIPLSLTNVIHLPAQSQFNPFYKAKHLEKFFSISEWLKVGLKRGEMKKKALRNTYGPVMITATETTAFVIDNVPSNLINGEVLS